MATIRSLNFTPTSIAGCQFWLDAADPGSITLSGATVTAWRDKSSSGLNLNLPKNTNPVRGTAINGLNTVSFTSTNGLGQSTVLDGVKNFYWVSRFGTQTDFIYLMGSDSTIDWTGTTTTFIDSAFSAAGLRSATPATLYANNTNTTSSFAGLSTPAVGTTFLLSVAGITGSTRFQGICYDRAIGRGYRGDVGEVLCYMSALTIAEHQQVEGYLAWKWGLQSSLPSSHPYRYIAPNSQGLGYPSALVVPVPTQSFQVSNFPLVLFNPTSLSGCTLWLDGTTGVTANVWRDRSTSANNLTRTGGTITTTTVNGAQALSFSSATMTYANTLIFNGTSGSSCFIVAAPTLSGAHLLRSEIAGNGSLYLWPDGNLYENIGFSTRQTISGFSSGVLQIYTNIANRSSNTVIFRNGTQIYSTTYGSGYTSVTYSVNGWTGTVCEILIYTRTLSVNEQQQIEGYLAWKWGLQASLPSTSPYRNAIPGGIVNVPLASSLFLPISFSPRNISGIQLWVDGRDPFGTGTVPSNGDSIVTWFDKSGNGNDLTAVGSPAPTYVSATTNISYGGSSTNAPYYTRTGLSIPQLTFFAIARKTSGDGPLFGNTTTTGTSGFFPRFGGTYYLARSDSEWATSTSPFSDGTTYMYSINYNSTSNINLWSNGSISPTISTTQTGTITRDSLLLGRRNFTSATETWVGTFSEVIQYNTSLTTSQRQSVEGYLAWKWGLQGSLPANHPFKNFPPPPN